MKCGKLCTSKVLVTYYELVNDKIIHCIYRKVLIHRKR